MTTGVKKTPIEQSETTVVAPMRMAGRSATSGSWKKGEAPDVAARQPQAGPGRPPIVPNKITRTMKDAAVAAAEELGWLDTRQKRYGHVEGGGATQTSLKQPHARYNYTNAPHWIPIKPTETVLQFTLNSYRGPANDFPNLDIRLIFYCHFALLAHDFGVCIDRDERAEASGKQYQAAVNRSDGSDLPRGAENRLLRQSIFIFPAAKFWQGHYAHPRGSLTKSQLQPSRSSRMGSSTPPTVKSFEPRMVRTKCGTIGADVRPNWPERERR
jgi:hypothetical protein